MGCFDCRCAISGLPLKAGDPLRFILLTSNGDPDSTAHRSCYIGDWWSPRTMPIKGIYNDYGGVEDVQEGLCQDLWVELLRRDLVEKGTGDNQCHDVPVSMDMKFEDLMEPLWKGRLEVHGSGQRPRVVHNPDAEGEAKYEQPEWLPTLRSVTALLPDPKQFLVEELDYGVVCIRAADGSAKGVLRAAQKDIGKRFATVITAGSGSYSFGQPVLRVFSPPKKEASIGRPRYPLPNTQMISFAMIREDVWQALLKLPLLRAWGLPTPLNTTAETCREEVIAHYHKTLDHYQSLEDLKKNHELKEKRSAEASEALGDWLRYQMEYGDSRLDGPHLLSGRGVHGPMVNPATHWNAVAKKQLPLDVVQDFVDSAAELVYVTHVLSHLEYRWIPTTTAGQGGNFRQFENFYAAMRDVAIQCTEEREAMYDE